MLLKRTFSTATAVPVVHILSPSPEASRRFRDRLAGFFEWNPVVLDVDDHRPLFWNQAFGPSASSSFWTTPAFDSIALECPSTGTRIHWISFKQQQQETSPHSRHSHELLGIVETSNREESVQTSLAKSIKLARSSAPKSYSSTWPLLLRHYWKQKVSVSHLLGNTSSPLLDLIDRSFDDDDEDDGTNQKVHPLLPNTLKEIAVATHDTDAKGSFLERLSQSTLHRPVSGVYQLAGGICLRPLPAAMGDQGLSPPSLIFHCDSLTHATERIQNTNNDDDNNNNNNNNTAFQIDVVGRTGARTGQVRVRHGDFYGMDIRLCQETKVSSMFAEAQEALLAGSLDELQSQHVLQRAQGSVDPKTERMDCWVEFRATVKNPRGFFLTSSSSSSFSKSVKAPDLPPE